MSYNIRKSPDEVRAEARAYIDEKRTGLCNALRGRTVVEATITADDEYDINDTLRLTLDDGQRVNISGASPEGASLVWWTGDDD